MMYSYPHVVTVFHSTASLSQSAVPSARLAAGPGGVSDGLVLWLKASNLALSDGAAVTYWPDASPLGNHATQSNTSAQPVFYTQGLNGLPTVSFDGQGDFLQGTLELPVSKTFLAAFKDTGSPSDCCSGVGVQKINKINQHCGFVMNCGFRCFGRTQMTAWRRCCSTKTRFTSLWIGLAVPSMVC